MNSVNKLREAREDELESLISKAEKYLPHTVAIHGLLIVGFRRKIFNWNYTKIYLPVDDNLPFFIIITGVVIKQKRKHMTAYWDPNEIETDVAKELLLSVPGWNWEEPSMMYSIWTPVLMEIKKIVMGENGISNGKLNVAENYGYCYTLDEDSFTENTSKTEFLFAPLTVNDAELVYENWVYIYAEDMESIRKNLQFLPSIAAYVRVQPSDQDENARTIDTEDDGKNNNKENILYKPVSWALTRPYGEIGFNFTFPEYRNKGLGAAVTKELTKRLLQESINPFVNIAGINPAAVKAVEKIGFRKYSPIGYQVYLKKGMLITDF